MENNTVKKDNRKALPKYLLILFVAAIFGGVLGFACYLGGIPERYFLSVPGRKGTVHRLGR